MKRRKFLRRAGAGATMIGATSSWRSPDSPSIASYAYPKTESIDAARNDEGLIALRIGFTCADPHARQEVAGRLSIKKGKLARARVFRYIDTTNNTYTLSPTNGEEQVITIWLADASEGTLLSFRASEGDIRFTLGELLKAEELNGVFSGLQWRSHLLFYHEIGTLDPEDLSIPNENSFTFVAMADPQGGDPFEGKDILKTRMRIHNAFIEESVSLVQKINVNPAFTIVIGDITDDWGAAEDFEQMNTFLQKCQTPLLYGIGNHETALRSTFGPGYNMQAFDNYFAAQKAVNGLELLLYSFNLGQWHFVVWPDPLRPGFWESHTHYFDWLERDLEKHKDRPTMIFQHVPIHPIGIVPLIDYAESVFVKRELLRIFARQGNVKYVLSGHVHIPVRASFKTAVEMEGIRFINLPAAGYRPRAFGEEDFHGGPSQGIAIVEIDDKDARITVKTVTEEEYAYPPTFRTFDQKRYPLWLGEDWELLVQDSLQNGSFANGLEHWHQRFMYVEDEDPANVCQPRLVEGRPALYLFNRKRGHVAPGQDRLPQDINKVFQMVKVRPSDSPALRLRYRIEEGSALDDWAGAYVWIAGHTGRTRQFNLIYSINPVWANLGGRQESRGVERTHIHLPGQPRGWNDVSISIASDLAAHASDRAYGALGIDRLMIKLGVWNANDGDPRPFGVYFTDLSLVPNDQAESHVNNQPLVGKDESDRWWRGKLVRNANIAGEHRYMIDTDLRYTSKK